MKIYPVAMVIAGALVFMPPTFALTVFDPANYVQNTLTAVRTLEQVNNQINQAPE